MVVVFFIGFLAFGIFFFFFFEIVMFFMMFS